MSRLSKNPLHLIIVIILLLVGALYLYAQRQQQRHDANATAYLHSALADIGSWQEAALERQLAPEARAAVSTEQLQALAERYRPLGAFERLDDLQFARLTAALSLFSGNTLLSYSGQARFHNGSAALTTTLIWRDGEFRLYNFNLSTPQTAAND